MSKLNLGVNNCFAVKRWIEPEVWASIVANDLGLASTQFSFDLLDPLTPEPVRSIVCECIRLACAEHAVSIDTTFTGLVAYSGNMLAHPHPGLRRIALRWYEEAARVSSLLGARGTGGFFGSLSMADYLDETRQAYMRSVMVESIRHIAQIAHQCGQRTLLWEIMPHAREIPHDPEEAIELLAEANETSPIPIGLCFDLGHCCAVDLASHKVDLYAWLERLLSCTYMVHLQQTDGKLDRHWPFTREFNRLGVVHPERVVELVKSSSVPCVDLVLEIYHPPEACEEDILSDLKESVEAFVRWM